MNKIPIVFAFDNNLSFPAAVCIYSLLANAKPTTTYDIFILHHKDEQLNLSELDTVMAHFPRHTYHLRQVDDTFNEAFEIRGITNATYYRLLIPELIPEYDKVIYSDVDVIFRSDLTDVFNTNIKNKLIAATYDWGMLITPDGQKYISSNPKLSTTHYIQAGFILLNLTEFRQRNISSQLKLLATTQHYKFQDQDIINIVCEDSHILLPFKYNVTDYAMYFYNRDPDKLKKYYDYINSDEINNTSTLHFNGHKPWKGYCVNFDIWWEYYRKSPIFNEKFYFDFFYNKLDELDQLSLWKRIKILIRYFTVGKK